MIVLAMATVILADASDHRADRVGTASGAPVRRRKAALPSGWPFVWRLQRSCGSGKYSNEVCGLILVDATQEDQYRDCERVADTRERRGAVFRKRSQGIGVAT